jgi:hypothetical protein
MELYLQVAYDLLVRLRSEFVCLLFLQDHRETDRFFAGSGVQFPTSSTTVVRCWTEGLIRS